MTQNYAGSVMGEAIRVTRLEADGSLSTGPSAAYVLTGNKFISLSFTPEYEDGDDISIKGADGSVCLAYKAPDTLKRVTLEIAICEPDPEFAEILTGGTLLTTSGVSEGWASPEVGVISTPNGVAIEVFSKAVAGGKPTAVKPHWHWVLPYVMVRPSGDRAIQGGELATTYSGYGLGNAEFGTGPGTPSWPFATSSPYAYSRTATVPSVTGYQTVA